MRNYHKQDMASVQWLAKHFFAKSSQRFRQFGTLPVFPGDRVLDLCCGPGFFTRYAADLIGPAGHVTGLDHDPVSLDFAARYLAPFPFKNWDFVHSDIAASLDLVASYDVVLLMNCVGYLESPESLIKGLALRARDGTRIIIKDFDLGSIFLAPIDPTWLAGLLEAAKTGNDRCNPLRFDNFLGRRVPFFHRLYDFSSHYSDVWAQCLRHPFNEYEVEYIWRNVEALVLQAKDTCDTRILDYFENQFCRERKPFFDQPCALFTENEYLTILTV